MKLRIRTAVLALTMAITAGASVASAPVASATTQAWAPACISRVTYSIFSGGVTQYWAVVTNHCGKTMRVRVKWQISYSDCRTLVDGQSTNFLGWNPYDGTQTC